MLYNRIRTATAMTKLIFLYYPTICRKPPIISPGLIQVHKPFLMGLYTGGGAYVRGGGLYMDDILSDALKHHQDKHSSVL